MKNKERFVDENPKGEIDNWVNDLTKGKNDKIVGKILNYQKEEDRLALGMKE